MSDTKHSTVEWPLPALIDWQTQCETKPSLSQSVLQYCRANQLGADFTRRIPTLYWPMALWLADKQTPGEAYFIGINGAQGSGKSTLAGLLALLIERGFSKRVLNLSIDDLYLSKAERQQLAQKIHPLFATRGVPGTHDVDLGLQLFEKIKQGQTGDRLSIPRFDKAQDDRLSKSSWDTVELPIDIVLFEGWCVGAKPQSDDDLMDPVNELEAGEDSQCVWRKQVNKELADSYQKLFGQLDLLMMLRVPGMEQVYQWRQQQETDMAAMNPDSEMMGESGLVRFIQHYERLTYHQLDEMPQRVDLLLSLNEDHQVKKAIL